MKTDKEKIEAIETIARELVESLPMEIFMKGDGSFWVQDYGADFTASPRKARNDEILRYVAAAIRFNERYMSVI